jgi:hypothetical protein
MSRILVTGVSGRGKSTALADGRRGYGSPPPLDALGLLDHLPWS